ncbi:MAG: hypothetical protein KKC19_03770 [Nanoarchaeota archaeon]|nr:hypothetical protein [Nanoarchaeota archaeon]
MGIYHLIPQESGDYCVCSVLQAVLNYHGDAISQEEIAREVTPGCKGGFLINDNLIKDFMSKRGYYYKYFSHNETPFNEPDFLLDQMSAYHGLVATNSHVRLLQDFIDPKLILIDPADGSFVRADLGDVRRVMASLGGGFGLIKKL